MIIDQLDEARKLAVINAALQEFATRGYDLASTNIIAKNAGISKGLMFHYVESKEALFLFLLDYCSAKIQEDYLQQIDFQEPDIFQRLEQSYVLQANLMQQHPWLLDFNQRAGVTKSAIVNQHLAAKAEEQPILCFDELIAGIDGSNVRQELPFERTKQLIYWSVLGFTDELLEQVQAQPYETVDYETLVEQIHQFFHDLRIVFYQSAEEVRK